MKRAGACRSDDLSYPSVVGKRFIVDGAAGDGFQWDRIAAHLPYASMGRATPRP